MAMKNTTITNVKARQILDSRGNPTIEVDVYLVDGSMGRAAVPSGASTGSFEAYELRDNNPELYNGKGVLTAVRNAEYIGEKIINLDAANQREIDEFMIKLEKEISEETGKKKIKENLGANAILGVSLAAAKAAAQSYKVPLYGYIAELFGNKQSEEYIMPVPMINIWNGGSHAGWATDIQEYMIMPIGAGSFSEGLRWCAEVFQNLKGILGKNGYATTVGDEGGFAPLNVKSNEEPLEWIKKAVESKKYRLGEDIAIAIDSAASAFYEEDERKYFFNCKQKKEGKAEEKTSEEIIKFYKGLKKKYPIISIEDGLSETDWDGWVELTKKLGKTAQIIGDDIYVTNMDKLKTGIQLGASNSILIKLNQIGTLTETLDTIHLALKNGYTAVVSHRSGETEDTIISHLAVGTGIGQIKTGSVCRGERICKYNELLRIEEELGRKAVYNGRKIFQKFMQAQLG